MSSQQKISSALAQAGLVPLDAQVLLAHVLHRDRVWLIAHGDDALSREQADAFHALARRRRDGEPVAYLVGKREFWGLDLALTPEVLIPRPETETLVEVALHRLPSDREARALDLGTGSGAIALAIARERPRTRVLAIDIADAALAVARGNAQRLAIANVEFVRSNWYSDLGSASIAPPFDLIVSNPPYIARGDPHLNQGDVRFEPSSALVAGFDGLDAIRQVVAGATSYLVADGMLIVEHGYDQAEAVRALFIAAGFAGVLSSRDLAGIPRVMSGTI